MNNALLNPARHCIERAKQALELLEAHDRLYWDRNVKQFKAAWSDILVYGGRTFTKCEQAFKSINKPHLYQFYKQARSSDELLNYLHHARNVDEHGLGTVLDYSEQKYELRGVQGKPFSATPKFFTDGTMTWEVGTKWTEAVLLGKAKYVINRVSDRGRWYEPPTMHLGTQIDGTDMVLLARLYISYITLMVDDLEQKIP